MASRWFFHFLLFALTFGIEVRVKAAENIRLPLIHEAKLIQQPRNCLNKIGESCALATFEHQKFLLKFHDANVWMDENTSLVRVSSHDLSGLEKQEIRILKGQVWVSTSAAFRVSGDYGAVTAKTSSEKLLEPEEDGHSDFWVQVVGDQMIVSSVTEPVILEPRNSKETLLLPAGLENRLGKSDENGIGTSGVPMPMSFGGHVIRWARLFSGNKKTFEEAVEKFYERWLVATRLSADINQAQVERRMETLSDQAAKEEAKAVEAAKLNPAGVQKLGPNGEVLVNGSTETEADGPDGRKPASVVKAPPPKKVLTPEERRRLMNQRVNDLFRKKFFSGE